jgi:hypothetical protein
VFIHRLGQRSAASYRGEFKRREILHGGLKMLTGLEWIQSVAFTDLLQPPVAPRALGCRVTIHARDSSQEYALASQREPNREFGARLVVYEVFPWALLVVVEEDGVLVCSYFGFQTDAHKSTHSITLASPNCRFRDGQSNSMRPSSFSRHRGEFVNHDRYRLPHGYPIGNILGIMT